jgi:tripartite-type tricarboxylate transporter receptor subunit TctC
VAGEAVRAAPNGRLLLTMESAFTVNPFLMKNWTLVPYKDFTPISLMGSAPLILVVPPSIKAKTLQELIALAKANPGKLTYGSAGSGNTTHLSPELLKFKAGLDIVQVPYKGSDWRSPTCWLVGYR